MAILDLTLHSGGATYLSEGECGAGDVLNLALSGGHMLTVDGVELGLGRITGADARLTIVAGYGATVNIDQTRLDADTIETLDFRIDAKGEITLDGSDIAQNDAILTAFRVTFASSQTGAFTYHPPMDDQSVASVFHIDDMQPGHHFNILGMMRGGQTAVPRLLRLGAQPYDTATGYFHLIHYAGQAETHIRIRMDEAQASLLLDDWARPVAQRQYWKTTSVAGHVTGYSFIFPGSHVCYGDGAMVQTISGPRPVESLRAGDLLICADGVARALLWTSETRVSAELAEARADMRPVRIRAGALAAGYPAQDLVVSGQLRIWVDGPAVRAVTGGSGGLIAARHLVGLPGIIAEDCSNGTRYHHLLLATHEVLVVNGILSESSHLGVRTMRALDAQALAALDAVLPLMQGEVATRHPLLTGRSARQVSRIYGHRREMLLENPGPYPMPASARHEMARQPVFAAE